MKKNSSDEIVNRTLVPILALDLHYEYLNELKAVFADLKKVNKIAAQFTWNEKDLKIEERIKDEVVLITDLDLKIVFASNGIKRMTGYKEEEVLGKTPKMFQGPATSKSVIEEIKEAIKLKVPFKKTIENYKKDGRTYKCHVDATPVYNLKGKISHFIAFEKEDKTVSLEISSDNAKKIKLLEQFMNEQEPFLDPDLTIQKLALQLDFSQKELSKEEIEYLKAFQTRIPPLNFGQIDNHKVLVPAKSWERVNNSEVPQLYPVYPWGIYGVGKSYFIITDQNSNTLSLNTK
mgnify:CR=1 FL=1